MSQREITAIGAVLKSALGPEVVNDLGRAQGQSKRLRVVTPFRLAISLIGAMASGPRRTAYHCPPRCSGRLTDLIHPAA